MTPSQKTLIPELRGQQLKQRGGGVLPSEDLLKCSMITHLLCHVGNELYVPGLEDCWLWFFVLCEIWSHLSSCIQQQTRGCQSPDTASGLSSLTGSLSTD